LKPTGIESDLLDKGNSQGIVSENEIQGIPQSESISTEAKFEYILMNADEETKEFLRHGHWIKAVIGLPKKIDLYGGMFAFLKQEGS
jgi:hypothetical protein